MKMVGIVGGLGTETSCTFCLNVNRKVHQERQVQPNLLMDNVPMPLLTLEALARGEPTEEVKKLLIDSIDRLNLTKPSFIVIPCNTVHIFIDELRKQSRAPILSIIEETVQECKRRSFEKIGVLCSSTTAKFGLYTRELRAAGISAIEPDEEEQQFISECILRIIDFRQTEEDQKRMTEIITHLQNKGAQAIILGCSDLFLLIHQVNSPLPLINSTEVFERSVVERLIKEER